MSSSELTGIRQKPKFSVAITTDGYKTLINNTLSDPARAQRFVASITSAVAVTPALQDCDAGTILAGALLGESLGLSPSPQLGQYYLVPFECRVKGPDGKTLWALDEKGEHIKDKKGKWLAVTEKKAQFVLGYKGYIQLALRSGQYADLDVMEIKEGEYLGKDPSTGKPRFQFIEDDDERDQKQTIGYMAYFEYLNGFKKSLYWTKAKMLAHADQYSQAFSAEDYKKYIAGEIPESDLWMYSSYWYKDFDAMAEKTMLRQLISRWGVMSIQLQQALTDDGTFASAPASGAELLKTPEDKMQITQPEAEEVVESVNLDDL